ncbi:glucosamine-6-phosphate deaminase [Fimbriiglobus ruber]|uniref:Glucosamine-6-phosphate deaminase n=1 Tax=Fimbriiglobus ruber TaxID=1908690 RepID=A0A225DZB6_9BACT|nr:glucosamine-6-phosphate deaminase [Fimbriiglobus ruber]OWK46323.1 Glucosamine-6-phosphate deaminase [Fimbriiglobus ruber]
MPAPHYLPHTRIPTLVLPVSGAAAKFVAREIDKTVRARNAAGKSTVLGLATGSTPVGLYRELIRMHKEEGLDLARVITFNLDEYYPLPKEDPHSYFRWMHETFFNHVNIKWENIHIPDGTLRLDEVDDFCAVYERKIKDAGGVDIQILGIGRTGHIGFNEPGSPRNSRTRMVTLDSITRQDAAAGFFGEQNVPNLAITMGVASIMDARKVFLMAFGEHKAAITYKAIEAPPTEAITASFLQEHPDAVFVLDQAAAAELTAIKRPWEVGPCEWTPETVRRAVVHLSLASRKGLQKLNDDDFRDHHLYDLLREKGPAERIGEEVFHDRIQTIQLYPAGKEKRNILVFSPHPDDDVISMGGTIIRLVEQGHSVHVAYMTSGNIAVFDHDARRFIDYVDEFSRMFNVDPAQVGPVKRRVDEFLDSKKPGEGDSEEVLKIKSLIRATEARAAALACGIPPQQLEFMNLRFYQTGTVAKDPIHPKDVDDIIALLTRLKPAQIYVAGEMSDPHGTHRLCAEAIFESVRRTRATNAIPPFDVWLYRGAWEEWEPHEIEMAVPVSPETLEKKKQAIFRHQSQKDRAMFPGGSDRREFWQRAEDRNLATARTYDFLGLPEYYALEAFVKWKE